MNTEGSLTKKVDGLCRNRRADAWLSQEPGSVEWLSAMKKRAEPQHANPSQATDARKGATTSFTAAAYWKFESIPLQPSSGESNKLSVPLAISARRLRSGSGV